MSEQLWYQAYRDEFADGLYPFADNSTLRADGGAIALMTGMLLDAAIYPVTGVVGARITQVTVTPGQVTLTLGDSGSPATCSTTFDPRACPASLDLTDALSRPAGLLVVDPQAMAASQTWPNGSYTFSEGAADFVARCCFPTPPSGVLALEVAGTVATGDVWLVGGPGVVLSIDETGSIRVDVVGDALSSRANCQEAGLFVTPAFVTTLAVSNGTDSPINLTPDAAGDIQLVVGDGLALDTALRLIPSGVGAMTLSVVGPSLSS